MPCRATSSRHCNRCDRRLRPTTPHSPPSMRVAIISSARRPIGGRSKARSTGRPTSSTATRTRTFTQARTIPTSSAAAGEGQGAATSPPTPTPRRARMPADLTSLSHRSGGGGRHPADLPPNDYPCSAGTRQYGAGASSHNGIDNPVGSHTTLPARKVRAHSSLPSPSIRARPQSV